MTSEYLNSKRVRLRQYGVGQNPNDNEDFDLLLDLNSDPDVMKYLTNGVPSSRDDVQAGVDRTLSYQKKFDGKLGVWLAELIETGEFMGWFHLRPGRSDPENTKDLELGYRLKKKFWGKDYATEVSIALIKKAFEEFKAESVFAQTLAENQASRRVMEKIGMQFEREFIDHDHPGMAPAVLYRLRRGVWAAASNSPVSSTSAQRL